MKERDNQGVMTYSWKGSKKPTLKQRRNWYSIKIVLGAYLIYLSWQFGTGIYNGQAGNHPVLLGIVAAIFCIFGVFFIVINVRSLRTDKAPDETKTLPEEKTE